jgi:hypothetical protein
MFKETPEAQAKIVAIGQEMALVKSGIRRASGQAERPAFTRWL